MLRVISLTELNECTLQIGDYLPISFRCLQLASLAPLYWRTGDFKKSLLEVGLNQNTGAICKVTVTLIGSYSESEDDPTEGTNLQDGLPVCDISEWPKNRYRDEPFNFATAIGPDSVSMWIAPKAPLTSLYAKGKVRFGTDGEGVLRLLQFKNLSRVNIERMLKTVR